MNKLYPTLSKYILADKNAITVDLDRSHGSWLVDDEGRERLDLFSQYASQPLGWNDPDVLAQKDRLIRIVQHNVANPDFYTPEYAQFVETFASFGSDFKHFFFIAGGTLGVENALKAAFDYKAKKNGWSGEKVNSLDVIHFRNAFHGRSGYTLSLTNTTPDKTDNFPKFDWTRMDIPNDEIGEESVLDEICGRLNHNKEVAAILIEPIQGEGGDNHFTPSFMFELKKLADEYDVMLILDEVQTGMGLTGKTWAYEHYGIVPDLISFGKKVQVCGCASTGKIDAVPDNVFKVKSRINSTWGGNLVDMVRSTISMEVIRERKLIENAAKVGKYFQIKLAKLGLENLRGKGLMIAFDLPNSDSRNKFLDRLHEKAIAIKCGKKSVRLRPHLTFGTEEADLAVDMIRESL
jgi:L-lysine 6-transaminase